MPPRKNKKIIKEEYSYDTEELAALGIFVDNDNENIEDEEEKSCRDCD